MPSPKPCHGMNPFSPRRIFSTGYTLQQLVLSLLGPRIEPAPVDVIDLAHAVPFLVEAQMAETTSTSDSAMMNSRMSIDGRARRAAGVTPFLS